MTKQIELSETKQPTEIEPALVSDKEAAAMLRLSVSEFHRLLSSGRLGFKKIKFATKCVRYSLQEIRDWCRAGCPSRGEWVRMENMQYKTFERRKS